MYNTKFLLLSFFLFFISLTSSSSSWYNNSTPPKCSVEQSIALLMFKESLSSINSSYYYHCFEFVPVMKNWKRNSDCCKWNGVICNHFTGDVIALHLSCGMLQGNIHPNTTLFHLPHLQTLNLAFNKLTGSKFLQEIGRLPTTLTHLNISGCWFTGEISTKMSFFPRLVSLDLSYNNDIQIQSYVLNNLLQNSTHLRELLIGFVDIISSGVLPTTTCLLNISSTIKTLDLSETGLKAKSPNYIFNLPVLEKLVLSHNYELAGLVPEVNKSTSHNALRWLDLSHTSLSGEIPHSIGQLKCLDYLDLSFTSLSGEIPHSIGQLKSLTWLDLSYTNISGEIPNSMGHLISLKDMHLSNCRLMGTLPKSLLNLRNLTTIFLSSNMLNGTLPSFLFTLPLLTDIILDHNMFSGGLPLEFFSCRSLARLSLRHNQFDGDIHQGSTPPSHIQLFYLYYLDLSYNNFNGLLELNTFLSMLPNLIRLHLSYSGLSIVSSNATANINPFFDSLTLASCKLTSFPKSLRAMKNLYELDLSNNNIHGHIPRWVGEIGGNGLGLDYLNLSYNSITSLPPQLQWRLSYLYLQSNRIQGPFPPSICNMSGLEYLDMSSNSFGGVIPKCVENMSTFGIIDLRNNHFNGTIPNVCECQNLESLLLNGNQLEGEVPTCFFKCSSLKIIDLGNNLLNGTFPHWLGYRPNLLVLDLRSNKLHGSLDTSSKIKFPFRSLHVLDLSNNGFVGRLPPKYFQNFNAMKGVVRKGSKPQYLKTGSFSALYYSIIVVVKGQELSFPKILVDYTIVDLSNNKFEGEIPSIVGTLNSLIVLNLSHNNLNGDIPHALGSLSNIESLDLSWNELTGEIPQSLVDLNFLSCLNLSENHLVGRIPQGNQFNTFNGSSYVGNPKLCGFPLSNACEGSRSPLVVEEEDDEDEEENGFTWKVVMLGYGCGSLLGFVMGYLMLSIGRPKWFNAIADAGESMIHTRTKKKRRYIYIGK